MGWAVLATQALRKVPLAKSGIVSLAKSIP
jgi:hypothetical protein